MKYKVIVLLVILGVLGVFAYNQAFSQNKIATVNITVLPAEVNLLTVGIDIENVKSNQYFEGSASTMFKVSNVTNYSIIISAENLTALERLALQSLTIIITLSNETWNQTKSFNPLNNEHAIFEHLSEGLYNVNVTVKGRTAVVNETTMINFNITANFFIMVWQTVFDSTWTKYHEVKLENLLPNTKYYFQVCSCDQAGNCACSPLMSFVTESDENGKA